jgi:REP element-mobilizing transposase RayT
MGLRNRSLFDKEGNIYFITTTVMNWDKIFSLGDNYNKIVIDSFKHLLNEHQSELIAYVIMPTHIHLIPLMKIGESISDFMREFKKFTSTKIRKLLEEEGYNKIVEQLRLNANGYKNQTFKFWMDRFDDVIVITENVLKTKVDYIHYNPVKAGLVAKMEDWKYSSARNYMFEDHSVIEVNTKWDFEFEKVSASGRKS